MKNPFDIRFINMGLKNLHLKFKVMYMGVLMFTSDIYMCFLSLFGFKMKNHLFWGIDLKGVRWIWQALGLRRLLLGGSESKKRRSGTTQKPSWMMPISHGYHVIEDRPIGRACDGGFVGEDSDSVVVQREQVEETEVWYFGVSDPTIGDGITKHMQSHFFDRKPKLVRDFADFSFLNF